MSGKKIDRITIVFGILRKLTRVPGKRRNIVRRVRIKRMVVVRRRINRKG